jgi:hypothetical protein
MFASRRYFPAVALVLGLPVLFAAVGALCERPVRFRRMHAAFARGGVAGRAAAAVFTPGWATGLVFVALAGGLVAAGYLAWDSPSSLSFRAACVSLAAAGLVFPLPVLLFLPRLKERVTLYVAVQAIGLALLWVADDIWSWHMSDGPLFIAGLVVLAIVLAIVARPWLREMRHTQRRVTDRRPAS